MSGGLDEIFSDGFETGDTRYWANGSGSTGYFEYTFNAADQLTGVLNGPNLAGSYSYDGDGLRVAVDDGQGGMLYYLRGPDGNTLAEYDDMGSLVAEYLYAGGRQIGKVVPDGSGGDDVSFFHSDHLGSALVITDGAGSVTWTGDYYPFGEPFSSSETPDRYRFTQHELDTATSLFYAKARYYHPHIGRFLTTDPVGGLPAAPQSWNRYGYAQNNPNKYTDPGGETPQLIGGLIGAIAGAVVGGYQETKQAISGEYHSPMQVIRNIGASVVGGAVTGAAAATFGPTTLSGGVLVGGGTSVLGGGVRRALDDPESGQDFADPVAATTDFVAGGIGGGISVAAEGAFSAALKPVVAQRELEVALVQRSVRQATGGSATGTRALVSSRRAAIEFMNRAPAAGGAVVGEVSAQMVASHGDPAIEMVPSH